jgi:hypothetical protein
MAQNSAPLQVDFWLRRMDLRRRKLVGGVIARAVAGTAGMLLTPLIGFVIAICFGYLLVVFVIATTTQTERDVLAVVLLLVIYGIYLGMVGWAFRSEYQTGLFLYEGAQHKPPADIIRQPKMVPFFYVPLGLDLLQDDAPVGILMRLPVYWARILARAAIQLRVYRSVKEFNPAPAAQILAELAKRGEGIKTEELLQPDASLEILHDPITYLIVLDMIGITPAWSKIWLNPEIRRSIEAN